MLSASGTPDLWLHDREIIVYLLLLLHLPSRPIMYIKEAISGGLGVSPT